MKEYEVDELTGIYNRIGFYKETEKLFSKCPETKFVVVYWNIRRFKAINGLFGHKAGDYILRQMAASIKLNMEMVGGTYARLERDNFVMCFPSELINDKSFVQPGDVSYTKDGTQYHFASSYGLYIVENNKDDVAVIVDKSRLAMESANGNYVNPYAFYDDSMQERLLQEQFLMSECQAAISERQFEVYYQPVCNAVDGTIVSAEALVRWNHPKRGMISPGDFIPVFEKNGFIEVLDRYVWENVCQMQKKRTDSREELVPISVNVSRRDLCSADLCEDIGSIMEKYGIRKELFRIEVTESAYSENPQKVIETVKKLKEKGFTIMMDDFGSGYSSLNTLKDLPVDILKIDMRFMNDLKSGGKSAIILESVVRMAKWMNLRTVAEGVETKEELNFLKSVECEYIQGYYFYKPMPEKNFCELLDDPNMLSLGSVAIADLEGWDFSDIYNANILAEDIFQDMNGCMGIYEQIDDQLEIIRVNRSYYELMKQDGYRITSEERLISNFMLQEHYEMLLQKCHEAEESKDTEQMQGKRMRCDGIPIWLDIRIRFLGKNGKRKMFSFYLTDITRIKELEQKEYLGKYTECLFLVFDKVYSMDYEKQKAEVLYSVDSDEKNREVIDFSEFFSKYRGMTKEVINKEFIKALKDKDEFEQCIKESGRKKISVDFRIDIPETNYKWISATLLKVDLSENEVDYLLCIQRI